MILWTLCWKSIWMRRGRTLLTVLSIAAGVAAVVAVLQSTAVTRARLNQAHEAVASRVALEVVSADGLDFDEDSVPALQEIAGVKAAVANLQRFTTLSANEQRMRGAVLGIDLEQYRLIRDIELTAGNAYGTEGDVCLEASVAMRLGIEPGDTVRLLTKSALRPVECQVTGILSLRGASALEDMTSVYLPLETVQSLWRSPGKLSNVQVVVEQDANVDQVFADISRQLPTTLLVRKASSPADLNRETELLVTQMLQVGAALSVIAALFIVLNTFLMSVAERQRQLALMRIVGATPQQIGNLLYLESLLLSLVGTVIGVAAGLIGGNLLTQGMQVLFVVNAPPLPFQSGPAFYGLLFGPLITLVAVAWPAIKVRRTTPLTFLKPNQSTNEARHFSFTTIVGLIGLTLTGLLFVAAIREVVPAELSIVAMASGLIVCMLLIPPLLRPVSYLVGRLVERRIQVETILARRQMLRNVGRSTLTIGVLFMVTCTGIGVGNTILEVAHDIDSWVDRTIVADFLVRASFPRIDLAESQSVPQELAAEIQAIPGVASIDQVTATTAKVNGEPAALLVRSFSQYDGLPLNLLEGDAFHVREALLSGEAVIGSVIARRLGIHVGDDVKLLLGDVEHSLHIAGIIGEYTSSGSAIAMDRQRAERLFPIKDTHLFLVRCEPSLTAAVGEQLQSLAREQGLIFQSFADFRQVVRGMMSGVTSGLWLLLVLGLLIAAFGVVNTLGMNVLEQTRDLGLLRVVGMTSAQVRGTILLQALMMGVLGLGAGTVGGIFLTLLITLSFGGLYGRSIPFDPNPWLIGGYLFLGMLLVVTAAAIPAVRATLLQPLDAIHEE